MKVIAFLLSLLVSTTTFAKSHPVGGRASGAKSAKMNHKKKLARGVKIASKVGKKKKRVPASLRQKKKSAKRHHS